MIAKITKTFHMQKRHFCLTEDSKCIMPILYSKTSFAGFKFYYVFFLEAFCFLGIFSFFSRHFHEVCIISTL